MAVKDDSFILTTDIIKDIEEKENLGKILKRHEKLWFSNTRGVRKANVTFAMTDNEFEEYIKCKINIHYFAEHYCQIKREDGSIGPMTLRDYQKDIIDLYTKNPRSILMASRQTGKAQDLDSVVWTENGKKRFGDLKVYDKIYGDDGELTNVVGIYPQGEKDIYEVEFSDGLKVRCCDEHLWEVEKYNNKQVLQLSEIRKNYLTKRGDSIYYVKVAEPVNYPEKNLLLDPYLLGLIIGDGSTRHNRLKISTKDKEISDYLYSLIDEEIDVILEERKNKESYDYKIIKKNNKHKIISKLKELGLMEKLSYDKFIPREYLYGSISQRISLLQGLMDTDGFVTKNQASYSTSSKKLSENVRELCHSLGIRTNIRERQTYYTYKGKKLEGKKSYLIRLLLKNDYSYPIFRLKRKQSQIENKHFDWGQKRGIVNITYYGKKTAQCIEVDNENHLYLTDNYIPTHNTVSAAIVLLHFVLFNDDKGCMIVANKGKTVKEIIRKIKDIYKLLPFFLKKGVTNWNETQIAFENNSRIQTENRTKEPSIGFTIDLLYLDEFAHIPDNFIRDYYGAIIPVVSSIENSRIIITSTPMGYNMFWELITAAELPDDDPNKSPYKAMRVYWNQVPGREDTKIKILDFKIKKYGINKAHILKEIREKYDIKMYKKTVGDDILDCVKYDVNDEKTYIDNIRKIRIDGIPLPELAVVSNWQEEETKLIGSAEKFDQEYGLHFVTGDKILFNKETIDLLKSKQLPFDYIEFPQFKKLNIPYDSLKFVRDPNLFNIQKMKDYYILISVDLSEGLGKDYSVINIFKLILRDKEEIEKYKYESLYELFKIEQIGMYRNNVYSIREIAHIFYLIAFELFDSEKVKVVLENNTYGSEFLTHLPNVFDGDNQYSSSVFLRYKQNREDVTTKIGLRLTKDKHLIIDKEFQQSIRNRRMILHSEINISEITTFSKHETMSGNITYRAESGNDDVVMTTITLSTAFDNVGYKNLVDMFVNCNLAGDVLRYVESITNRSANAESVTGAYNKVYRNRPPVMNNNRYPSR